MLPAAGIPLRFLKRCKVTFDIQIIAAQVVVYDSVLAVGNAGLNLKSGGSFMFLKQRLQQMGLIDRAGCYGSGGNNFMLWVNAAMNLIA
jgi:hypothetical protein